MSTIHYITPYEPASWKDPNDTNNKCDLRISFGDFISQMKLEFNVTVSPPFSWVIQSDDGTDVTGSIVGDDMQILGLELGSKFAEFLIWYRSYIPDKYPLHLFRQGEWTSLELTANTSVDDIKNYI